MAALLSSCGLRLGRAALRVTPRSSTRSPSPSRTCAVSRTPFPRSSSLDEGLLFNNNCHEVSSEKSVISTSKSSSFSSGHVFTRSHSFEDGLQLKQESVLQRSDKASSLERIKSNCTEVKSEERFTSSAAQLPPRKLSYDETLRSNLNTEIQNDWKQELASLVAKGEMIPDTYVFSLVREKLVSPQVLEKNGWLLDGFPRTVAQADAMLSEASKNVNALKPTAMIVLEVSDEELLDRMIFRRIDPVTGRIYNLKTRPPKEVDILNRLITREDDREEVVRRRIALYKRTAAQIENIFVSFDIPVIHIDGSAVRNCEGVFCEIQTVLESLLSTPLSRESLRLVLSGPPGCGKGTQAELLSKAYDLFHLSTGNILREMLNGKAVHESQSTDLRSVGIVFGREETQLSRILPARKESCQRDTSFVVSTLPAASASKMMSSRVG
ncbi:adenylate kinase [Galdieria sulphuraria]|uniref:Adenylate kinase n=1 Tax=Galdieria sulphuraria TaxID=130081 RepID=M2Y836_GALSU|nr:adenylate kinase [Galdieria sulphuraria]EME32233.1 adenylate kinase [Galdieria sulphuraria]|eukprot:XP_005708753.1 adenylate kinase [Galdieria sulphuraria]